VRSTNAASSELDSLVSRAFRRTTNERWRSQVLDGLLHAMNTAEFSKLGAQAMPQGAFPSQFV